MEVRVEIRNIENLKTSTGVKVEKDKDGVETSRKLMTKIQFEAEIAPDDLAYVHRLLGGEAAVHVVIGSPQAVMEVMEQDHAFAEA